MRSHLPWSTDGVGWLREHIRWNKSYYFDAFTTSSIILSYITANHYFLHQFTLADSSSLYNYSHGCHGLDRH